MLLHVVWVGRPTGNGPEGMIPYRHEGRMLHWKILHLSQR